MHAVPSVIATKELQAVIGLVELAAITTTIRNSPLVHQELNVDVEEECPQEMMKNPTMMTMMIMKRRRRMQRNPKQELLHLGLHDQTEIDPPETL